MSIYLLERSDGGVSIMRLVGDTTPEKEVAKWPKEEQDIIVGIHPATEDDIPKDRTFRNAWSRKNPNKPIEVDMEKARSVWKDKIREARALRFTRLDVEYMRAEERGDEAKKLEIVERKKLLRELPQDPRIEDAKTVEELKAVWLPEPLPGVEALTPLPLPTPVIEPPIEKEEPKAPKEK